MKLSPGLFSCESFLKEAEITENLFRPMRAHCFRETFVSLHFAGLFGGLSFRETDRKMAGFS